MSNDNVNLYENIGDIVIQQAHAGDEKCLRIFELALRKTDGSVVNKQPSGRRLAESEKSTSA